MKAVLLAAVASLLTVSAFAAENVSDTVSGTVSGHTELAAAAQAQYALRDYSPAGIASAQGASEKYAEAATAAPDDTTKSTYLTKQSEALFFVGQASADKDAKVAAHLKGMQVADQAVKSLGITEVAKVSDATVLEVKAKLNEAQVALLGEALYERGINLGQWGAANGVLDSLAKWPELRRNMEVIDVLGLKAIHDYGAYRVMGRGFYKIPSLLGGNMKKAEKYLGEAVAQTKIEGEIYSRSGFNNIYSAEVLKEKGQDDKATELLQAFISADVSKFPAESAVEIRENQKEAKELLASW